MGNAKSTLTCGTLSNNENKCSKSKKVNALIIVDVQNDFITGSLALKNGEEVVPVINNLLKTIPFDVVVYTADWHPKNHISFYENIGLRKDEISSDSKVNAETAKLFDQVTFKGDVDQILWPTHCVQGTFGAQFHKDLYIVKKHILLHKGSNPEVDSYSAFRGVDHTSIAARVGDLKKNGCEFTQSSMVKQMVQEK
ncbi:unnamed protein product [Didymodactylos carnosus]|uniref:nicotinamidase n=1 Tax=Didymodactylos carnosus TaxID=1234261 RepID=A0A8S2E6S8_9BILA|nr:unnamed protein product [Didymodactylos carnosus]CAF3936006.1 unnamed protein product [Didymodactylos carnosus]